ncbi:LysM peptidoglycan-binding domain-containing protein [Deinococcus malanensis]|uniref:LysM peptidoglycan-binding domain-containing protein n=1 Tax=Deinococcus malanensis TaxID=1706855 RepID=UPI00363A2953
MSATHRQAWLLGTLVTFTFSAAHAAVPQPVHSAPAALTASRVRVTTTTYTVKTGDTLAILAQRFNTTVRELITMNNLTGTVIYVTQRLIVPATGSVTPVKPAPPAGVARTIVLLQSSLPPWPRRQTVRAGRCSACC